MPLYTWENETTKQCVEVVRTMSEIDNPPTPQEISSALKDEAPTEGVWRRIMGSGIKAMRSNAWGFGKGYYNSQRPKKYTPRMN